jgi:hypothetical protein
MTDKSKYDLLKRLSRIFLKLVNTPNARKYAERKKEVYRAFKEKDKARR